MGSRLGAVPYAARRCLRKTPRGAKLQAHRKLDGHAETTDANPFVADSILSGHIDRREKEHGIHTS